MTNPKKKPRKLQYRRAVWNSKGDSQENNDSLENYLKVVHTQSINTGDLTFSCGAFNITCANYKADSDGVYLQLAKYSPGSNTCTIDKNLLQASRQIFAEPAPEGKDYMEGDIFILVKDNHVLLCPSGARENIAIKYFSFIFNKVNKLFSATSFDLQIIANIDKLNLIQKEGVKEIILNASIYEASKQFIEQNNKLSGLVPNFIHDLKRIFAKDKNLKDIQEQENLNVSISLKFDGNEARKKKKTADFGTRGLERLQTASRMLLAEPDEFRDDDFEIVTYSGKRITPQEIQVSEDFNIEILGTSISRDGAWGALKTYYDKLKGNGILEL